MIWFVAVVVSERSIFSQCTGYHILKVYVVHIVVTDVIQLGWLNSTRSTSPVVGIYGHAGLPFWYNHMYNARGLSQHLR